MAFDTLTYANKLKSVGFTEEQAETQAEALKDIVEERIVSEIERSLKQLEARLIVKISAVIAAATTILLLWK